MKEKSFKWNRILEAVNKAKRELTPREVSNLTGFNHSTCKNYLRRMLKRGLIKQPYPGSYASEITYGMMRVPVRVQNVILSVAAPWLSGMEKIEDLDEWVEDVHSMVQFGGERRKITIRVACDAGIERNTLGFAVHRAYDVIESLTGHVVEKVVVRTIEKNRHFHGVSLDSVVKCMTVKAFDQFLDKVYEKKDGSGVRVERKISRDMEVDEMLEMLSKGAPAFETAYTVTELKQTVEKLIDVTKFLSLRQAAYEDQAAAMTGKLTDLVDSLAEVLKPKKKEEEPVSREVAPRESFSFYD